MIVTTLYMKIAVTFWRNQKKFLRPFLFFSDLNRINIIYIFIFALNYGEDDLLLFTVSNLDGSTTNENVHGNGDEGVTQLSKPNVKNVRDQGMVTNVTKFDWRCSNEKRARDSTEDMEPIDTMGTHNLHF